MPGTLPSHGQSVEFDTRLLELLACPVCLESLKLGPSGDRIQCASCLRAYPLADGIPVLIADRAMLEKPD